MKQLLILLLLIANVTFAQNKRLILNDLEVVPSGKYWQVGKGDRIWFELNTENFISDSTTCKTLFDKKILHGIGMRISNTEMSVFDLSIENVNRIDPVLNFYSAKVVEPLLVEFKDSGRIEIWEIDTDILIFTQGTGIWVGDCLKALRIFEVDQ